MSFISYLLGSKVITLLIESLEYDTFIPAISPYLQSEFLDVIKRPRIAQSLDIELSLEFMRNWVNFALYVKPADSIRVCRDSDDNAVLECGDLVKVFFE